MADPPVFIIDNAEQLDVTVEQAERLLAAGLIYRPHLPEEPDYNPNYFTTPWDVSLDDVETWLAQNDSSGARAAEEIARYNGD